MSPRKSRRPGEGTPGQPKNDVHRDDTAQPPRLAERRASIPFDTDGAAAALVDVLGVDGARLWANDLRHALASRTEGGEL